MRVMLPLLCLVAAAFAGRRQQAKQPLKEVAEIQAVWNGCWLKSAALPMISRALPGYFEARMLRGAALELDPERRAKGLGYSAS